MKREPSRARRDTSGRFVAVLALGTTVWALATCQGEADAYSRALALTRASGYAALVSLCCALCTTPLSRLLRCFRWQGWLAAPRLRRAFGIAAASFALVHAAQAWIGVPQVAITWLSSPRLRAGLGALVILALLLVTSFPRLVARLRLHFWKELHRLAYIAFALALLHALLGAFASLTDLAALAAVTAATGFLRLLPERSRAGAADSEGSGVS